MKLRCVKVSDYTELYTKKKRFKLIKRILKTHLGSFVNMEDCLKKKKKLRIDKFTRPDAPLAHGIMCFNTTMWENQYPKI